MESQPDQSSRVESPKTIADRGDLLDRLQRLRQSLNQQMNEVTNQGEIIQIALRLHNLNKMIGAEAESAGLPAETKTSETYKAYKAMIEAAEAVTDIIQLAKIGAEISDLANYVRNKQALIQYPQSERA